MSSTKKFEVFNQEGNFVNSYEEKAKAESLVSKHPGWYVKSDKAPADSTEDLGGDVESYDKLTNADLKAELEARKIEIPAGAKKTDLIALLTKDDEKNGEANTE